MSVVFFGAPAARGCGVPGPGGAIDCAKPVPGVVVAVAPMLLLFYLLQRNIARGLTAGAIK